MLYLVRAELRIPDHLEAGQMAELRERELMRAHELQRAGHLRGIWRLAGRRVNVAIFDATDHDELNVLLSSLPMFNWLEIVVEPLAMHPAQLAEFMPWPGLVQER